MRPPDDWFDVLCHAHASRAIDDCLAIVVARLGRGLVTFANHWLGDRSEAEDAAQSALLALFRELPHCEVHSRDELDGFLYRILQQRIAATHRSRSLLPESSGEFDGIGCAPPELTIDHELLARWLDSLSQLDQQIFWLRLAGHDNPEIAERIGHRPKQSPARRSNYIANRWRRIEERFRDVFSQGVRAMIDLDSLFDEFPFLRTSDTAVVRRATGERIALRHCLAEAATQPMSDADRALTSRLQRGIAARIAAEDRREVVLEIGARATLAERLAPAPTQPSLLATAKVAVGSGPRSVEALGELLRLIRPLIHAAVRGFTPADCEIEDLEQMAHLKILQRLPAFTFTTESRFIAWLQRVALNVARDHLAHARAARRDARRNQAGRFASAPWSGQASDDAWGAVLSTRNEDPAMQLSDNELLDRVNDLVAKLPDRDGRIASCILFESMSVSDAARVLGLPERRVRRAWCKVRLSLQFALGRTWFEHQRRRSSAGGAA